MLHHASASPRLIAQPVTAVLFTLGAAFAPPLAQQAVPTETKMDAQVSAEVDTGRAFSGLYSNLPSSPVERSAWDHTETLRQAVAGERRIGTAQQPVKAAPPPAMTRGGTQWTAVYRNVAPSVLFLALERGYGSGFLIGEPGAGWALTNHHVARGARLDEHRHWRVNAFYGTVGDDGLMVPSEEPIEAVVYAWDRDRDVALLRLEAPENHPLRKVPPLSLAQGDGEPHPGTAVAALGNAGIGLLWALKPGHVAAVGTVAASTPELLNLVNQRLRLSGASFSPGLQGELQAALAEEYRDWIGGTTLLIQATAPISPGDSGGPLLDGTGRVVGINMGGRYELQRAGFEMVPVGQPAAYYVHHREIRSFLADWPHEPLLELVSDPWSAGSARYALAPLGEEPERLMIGSDIEGSTTLIAADLDGSSPLQDLQALQPVNVPVFAVHRLGTDRLVIVFRDGLVVGTDEAGGLLWSAELQGSPRASAAAADGSLVAVALEGSGSIALLDVKSGKVLINESVVPWPVRAIAFEPRGQRFWLGGDGGFARLDASGAILDGADTWDAVVAIAVAPNGHILAVSERDSGLWLFDMRTGERAWHQAEYEAYDLAFTPDGLELIATPLDDSSFLTWLDVGTGEPIRRSSLPSSPWSLSISADGSTVGVDLGYSGEIALIDTESGELLGKWSYTEDGRDPQPLHAFHVATEEVVFGTSGAEVVSQPLAGDSRRFRPEVERLDLAAMVQQRRFDAEVAMVLDRALETAYILYDLDDDGVFDRIHVDVGMSSRVDAVYEWRGGRYVRSEEGVGAEAILAGHELPERWRARYARFLDLFDR